MNKDKLKEIVPNFLYELLLSQYKDEALVFKILDGYTKKRKVTLRANTIKTSRDEIKEELENNTISYKEVNWYNSAFIIEDVREGSVKCLDIYDDGEIYLQSLSSMLPPIFLDPKENDNILDMAAAPGGKTTQIAALSNNKSMITACEKNKIRADRLKYNLEKQGATKANVMLEDARRLSDYFSFDKILLDAPCSGSGTIHINNDVFPNNFTEELVNRSCKVQEELLTKALKILKPGGEMIYSTCSILEKENEEIVRKSLNKFNCEIVPIDAKWTNKLPKLPVSIEGTLCIAPTEEFEGFFVAKIKKNK